MDLNRHKLKLARQRLRRAQARIVTVQDFLRGYQNKIDQLKVQIENVNKSSVEYTQELPRLEAQIRKQQHKIDALTTIIRLDRELTELRRRTRRKT